VDQIDRALHRISGCDLSHFANEAERQSGLLRSNLDYTTIEAVFHTGLHQYLDQTQARLNDISSALTEAYCRWLDD
jgi:uncharacterized alpha-E superfamily protein